MTVPEHPTSPEGPPPSSSCWPDPRVARGAAPESVPRLWDESRDTAFFTLTARLFPPATTLAMTVLLASNDVDSPTGSAWPATRLTEVSAGSTSPLGDIASSDYAS